MRLKDPITLLTLLSFIALNHVLLNYLKKKSNLSV